LSSGRELSSCRARTSVRLLLNRSLAIVSLAGPLVDDRAQFVLAHDQHASHCALCHFLESMRRLKRRLKRISGTLGEFSQFPRGRWFSELAQFSILTLRCLPQSLSFLGNRFGGQARWRRTIASKSDFRIRPRQSGQFPFPFRAFPNSFLAVPRKVHRDSRGN
jgi:hypothetical protein